MKKRILSILMTICMLVCLMPATAFAEADYYITVAGVTVSEQNAGDVLGDGKVSYDVDSNTLTLNNATITTNSEEDAIHSEGSLIIELNGNNTLENQRTNGNSYGFYVKGGLTFTGDGNLTVSSGNCDTFSTAIIAEGDITVGNNCTIIAKSGTGWSSQAISISNGGSLVVNNASTVTASENSDGSSAVTYDAGAIDTYKYIKIEPASPGAPATEYDLWVGSTQVTSDNASGIAGNGITGTVTYNAGTNTLTLNNATITSNSTRHNDKFGIITESSDLNLKLIGTNNVVGQENSGSANYGMYINGNLTFSGEGSLNVSSALAENFGAWSVAMLAKGNITVSHESTIIAICNGNTDSSRQCAIYPGYSSSGNLILDNAKVTAGQSSGDITAVEFKNGNANLSAYKYVEIEPGVLQTLTVNNGSGGGNYVDGQTVTITANAPEAGKQLKEWTGADGLEFTGGTSKTSATAKFIMPARAVEVTATYADAYNINITTSGAGVVSASHATAVEGAQVTLTVTPDSGYQLKEWQVISGGVTISNNKFTMPATDVAIKAIFDVAPTPKPSTSSSSKPKYSATLNKDADTENGDISFSQTKVRAGNKVTITVTPEDGYELGKLVILDKDGNKVEFTDNGDGTYTFVMPKGGVEVEPFFEKVQAEQKPEKEKSTLVLFVDKEEYLLGDETKVNDVAPVIKKNRTTLPVRLVAETLGAKVDWNQSDRTVTITKGDKEIVIQIGQDYALVNGTKVKLDSSAYIDNNRTYMPVRFVAEALDAQVKWDENNRSVTIVEK